MSRGVEHAVELALDDTAAHTVTELCRALDAVGIASITSLSPHAHPHVSVTVARDAAPDRVAAVLEGLGTGLPALTLSSLGAFTSSESVVFLGVAPTEALLALHRAVDERLDAAGVAVRSVYRPGQWVPHCTLAMHVADVAAAVAAVASAPLPLRGASTALRVVEVPTGAVRATVG